MPFTSTIFIVTTALTNGDAAEAKIAANAIEAGTKDVAGASGISAAAAKITAASDTKAQRAAYSGMSKDMAVLIKKEGLSNGELYVAFCPMAFDDKGATWISGSKEIEKRIFIWSVSGSCFFCSFSDGVFKRKSGSI